MQKITFTILIALSSIIHLSAQTFNASPNANITDDGQHCYTINVTGVGTINETSYGLETVCIDIDHAYDADLDIILVAPDGTTIVLTSDNGADGDNYTNTCFEMSAGTAITAGTAPFNGTYIPEGDLANINNGQNADGVWQICITDDANGDDGNFNSWSITFGNNPATNDILIGSGINGNTYTGCDLQIYDDGGVTGDYSDNINETITVCSGSPATCPAEPQLTFNTFDLENNDDYIYVYDGNNTSAPQVAGSPFTGNTLPPTITATGGCITIQFVTDNDMWATGDDGFDISVSCTGNPPADDFCTNATQICNLENLCGNTSATYTTSFYDPSNSIGNFCGSIENNSWITFTASATSATLDVAVSNCTNGDGIQMEIYETNDCINFTSVSNCESPGTVQDFTITATGLTAGQNYYLMIDGFAGDVCDYVVNPGSGVMTADAIVTETGVDTALICGGCVHLDASGGTSYQWSPATGLDDPNSQTPTACPTTTTTYTVTVTGGNPNCPDNATADVTIIVSDGFNAVISSTPITCNGGNNGTATVDLSNVGTATQFTYAWSTITNGPIASTTNTITGLSAGTYNVTVTDDIGCQDILTITIADPPALVVTLTPTDESCNGANDGSISVDATNGTAQYNITWSPGSTVNNQNLPYNITSLAPNNYNITVTDNNGCTGTASTAVNQGPDVIANVANVTNQCLNGNSFTFDGTGSSPSGGTYSWDFGDGNTGTGANPSNSYSTDGSYTVTLTYTNGACSDIATTGLTVYPHPNASAVEDSPVTCNGLSDGQATASGGGSYSWPSGGTNATESGLAAGTYVVTVTSSVGSCTSTASVTITEPDALAITVSVNPTSCNGTSDGIASCSITTASTAPYDYQWSLAGNDEMNTTATSDVVNTFPAGTYDVTVTDDNGCSEVQNFTISEPNAWDITYVVTDATCGNATGAIDLTVNGGNTSPYTFAWSNVDNNEDISNILAGAYTVTISDASTCDTIIAISVADAGAPVIAIDGHTDPSCFGYTDGTVSASLTSTSTANYTYVWSTGTGTPVGASAATSTSVTGVGAGTITVQVTDGLGCTASDQITLTEPTAVTPIMDSIHNANCGQPDGDIYISVTGGTVTTDYTYTWNTTPAQNTQDATNIIGGTYQVIVTDDNSCTDTLTGLVVGDNPGINLSASIISQPLCAGDCNAVAEVHINAPTTGPYDYDWDNGLTDNIGSVYLGDTITGLCASTTYSVTVTDANGCTATTTIKPTDPSLVSAAIAAQTNIDCFGNNNGSASVGAHGGTITTDYSYLWDGGASITLATDTGLVAGTYNVVVTDDNGCTDSATVTITEPSQLTIAAISYTDETCSAANGDITVLANGGTPTYNYLWDTNAGSSTNATVNGLTGAITYWVTVTDANGCTASTNQYIDTIPAGTISIVNTNITCFGDNDGTATASVAGGTMPFDYVWNNGYIDTASNSASSQAIGVAQGSITVTMTDANGCVITTSTTITQPDQLVNTFVIDTLECNAYCDASINTTITGGTTPYTFIWDDASLSITSGISNLCAGTYNVTVTDAHNCTIMEGVTLADPPAMTLAGVVANSSCGHNDGALDLTVTNPTTPMSYSWTGPSGFTATTEDLTNVYAGTYDVTVTNGHGCTVTGSYNIIDEGSPTATITAFTNVDCYGAANGTATVSAIGGTGAGTYNYTWDDTNNQTTATATNLSGGTYNVTVEDANNCISTATVDIFEPTHLDFNLVTQDPSCNAGNDGWISVSPYGGTSPYTITWTGTGSNPTADTLYEGLMDGLYSVQITDTNACDTILNNIAINEPSFMSATSVITDVSCFGASDGSIALTVTGGTSVTGDYTYSWDSNTGGQVSSTPGGLSAGNYDVTVYDDNSCELYYTGTINEPTQLVFNSVVRQDLSCFQSCDGTIDVDVSGGTMGYTFYWETASNPGVQYSTQEDISNLCADTYFLVVTDANGCTIDTSIIINQPLVLTLNLDVTDETCYGYCNGVIDATITGGTTSAGTYNFLWSDNSTNEDLNASAANGPGCPGTYTLTVTDAHNCTIHQSAIINAATQLSIVIQNITDATCNIPNGEITVAVSGGTGIPVLDWDAFVNNANAANVHNSHVIELGAGTYYLEVTDDNSCQIDTTIPINNFGGPIIDSVVVTDISCYNADDGEVTIYWHQPNPPASTYTVTWPGYPAYTNQNTLPNLGPNTYCPEVEDNNGCWASACGMVNEPTELTSFISNVTDATCHGTCNGSATVNASGGTAPYSILWDNNAGSQTNIQANNLCYGLYQVTITDDNNCTTTSTALVNEPDTIVINLVEAIDASCNGYCDGYVTVDPLGGSNNFNYQWIGGGISSNLPTASNLCANTNYTLIVTDATDPTCQVSEQYTISEPDPIVTTDTSYNTTCNLSNGTVIITNVIGGTPGYSYQWSPGTSTSNSMNGLNNGNYNYTVTDSHSCQEEGVITVFDTPPPYLFDQVIKDVNCFGGNDGYAEIIVEGGTQPFHYYWSAFGSNDSIANDLPAGTYWVTVIDNNYCEVITTFTIGEPEVITIFVDGPTTPVCINQQTYLNASASGGSGTYTFVWSDTTLNGSVVTVYPLHDTVYTVYAIDGNGCTSNNTQVSINVYPPIHVTVSPDADICLGEYTQLTAVAVGGNYNSSYSYFWNTGSNSNPYSVSPSDTTIYYVWAGDLCGSPSDTASVTVNLNLSPQITSVVSVEGCEPLDATLGVTLADTNMIVTYLWNLGEGSSSSTEANPQHVYLNNGSYDIGLTLTSTSGCQLDTTFTGIVNVFPKPDAAFYTDKERASIFDPIINFSDATDDHGYPVTWNWDFGDGSPMATNPDVSHIYEQSGDYTIMLAVINNKGCVDTVYNNIEIYDEHRFYMPNAFRPNQDHWYYPKGIGIEKEGYYFAIYDRWGEIIFETTDYPIGTDQVDRLGEIEGGWNGKYLNTGKLVQNDIYIWYVTIVDVNGYQREYSGWVNVIR